MLDYFILAVTAVSLIFVFLLLKNNRKQRLEIKAHLEKIKKLQKDSRDYLDIYD